MHKWDDIEKRSVYQAPKWVRDGFRAYYSYNIDKIPPNKKGATNMSHTVDWVGAVEAFNADNQISRVISNAPATIETFYADNKPYYHVRKNPGISRVIFNDPATIVFWDDGTKTVVKCQEGDTYSKETGLALCIAKKTLGNKGNFNNVFKKWCEE